MLYEPQPNKTPSSEIIAPIYHGKHNDFAVAPIWQEYHWNDIIKAGIENAAEGTIIAKADNFVLKNGVSGELKIEILFNYMVNDDFMAKKIAPKFLTNDEYNDLYFAECFEKGNRCLILQLSHGSVKENISLEIPSDNDTKLKQTKSLILHEFLVQNNDESKHYFKKTGMGHIALSFVKQLALNNELSIKLDGDEQAVDFYTKEQFMKINDAVHNYNPMQWKR